MLQGLPGAGCLGWSAPSAPAAVLRALPCRPLPLSLVLRLLSDLALRLLHLHRLLLEAVLLPAGPEGRGEEPVLAVGRSGVRGWKPCSCPGVQLSEAYDGPCLRGLKRCSGGSEAVEDSVLLVALRAGGGLNLKRSGSTSSAECVRQGSCASAPPGASSCHTMAGMEGCAAALCELFTIAGSLGTGDIESGCKTGVTAKGELVLGIEGPDWKVWPAAAEGLVPGAKGLVEDTCTPAAMRL